MGIFLRGSLLCRLCGTNNDKGVKLFDNKTKLYALVNKYLPIKVIDDGILPNAICPGCHIHLQDIILFHDLIEKGQKLIDAIYEEELKQLHINVKCDETTSLLANTDDYDASNNIFKDNSITDILDGISQTSGNNVPITGPSNLNTAANIVNKTDTKDNLPTNSDQPPETIPVKRKRGRPKKSEETKKKEIVEPLERSSRTRKQPVRLLETVHGDEFDNVIKPENGGENEENGITSATDKDDNQEESAGSSQANKKNTELKEGIIGWIKSKTGKTLGSVMATKKICRQADKWATKLDCIICKKTFVYKSYLLRHLMQDKCGISDITINDVCPVTSEAQDGNVFPSNSQNTVPVSNKYKHRCMLCPKVFQSRCSLVYHEEKEHTYHMFYCYSCEKHFKHRLLLLRHQRVHLEVRPYKCDLCPNASFKYLSNLHHHQMTHSDKRFVCTFCLSPFTSKRSLEFHIRVHLGFKPFQCDVCQKFFSQKNNLLEHMRVHSGEKPYKCESCDRLFKTSSQLKTHSLVHSEVRPHVCDICKKSFRHKDTWCAHIRRHTGEKPFSCAHCGKSFLEGTGVRKHERLHTGEKRFACKHCDRPFADCSNLNKHRKKVHGEGIENSLARVIYLNLDLPQELNNLDLGNIETSTNTISALNLALGDMHVDPDIHVPGTSLESKTLPLVFKALSEPAMKDKDLNLLSALEDQLGPNSELNVPLVLKSLGHSVTEKDSENQLPIFSEEGMPLVLKRLEESEGPGKDMPALGLDSDVGETDDNRGPLSLDLPDNDAQMQVGQHDRGNSALSLAINTQSEIEDLKDLSGLVDSSRQIVTDSQGVPIKITMSDGTQLQVTTPDGESLEVMTSDGVPIPVRLSAPDFVLPSSLPNIDALTMEGALGEFSQLDQDYEIQFVEGHDIKLLQTTDDQTIKMLPSTDDPGMKLLTSATQAHSISELHNITQEIKLLSSSTNRDQSIKLISESKLERNGSDNIALLSSADGSSSIKLLTQSQASAIELIASSSAATSLSPPSTSHLKWTLHQ